jgi:DNA polymerase-3 subunit epsilon
MDFVALDVETANSDVESICQVGLADYRDGAFSEWATFVDPCDEFDPINVSIHGIGETTVAGAPTFGSIAARLDDALRGRVVVCHTHFDRLAIHRACEEAGVAPPRCRWLDTARVARRAWPELAQRGYGLRDVCNRIGYDFQHHDALHDAKAAAHVLIAAVQHTGLDLEAWFRRVEQAVTPAPAIGEANPDGPLYGEVVAFTGALTITRNEAARIACQLGCQVVDGVSKKTTLLVVGDQDVRRLAGHEKSSKHRKAEELIQRGHALRIVQESDFQRLIDDGEVRA